MHTSCGQTGMWMPSFYKAWIICHKPKRTAGAILLLRLVKYNDISVLSGFFSVCGWEQAPWHLWCTLSCWLAQAIWLMGNRATGTDFHSCSTWCQCTAKPSTHRFSLNGRSEVVCVRSGTLHLHACSASTNSHTQRWKIRSSRAHYISVSDYCVSDICC